MKSTDIRNSFLEFFRQRGHTIAPSSSLIPADPTLLLTAAGMVQFKPYFLGKESADFSRAASVQKCVRTTDIERVGHTARHLTFFEMLGNFSFGDYYKLEASAWAWEFLTIEMKLPAEKLWVTIFETDEEAYEIWRDKVQIPADRIVRLGEKDNFWSAGPTGPCGPCSEIIYDYGPERGCNEPDCGVGCDCDRYLEIWNLVFMQYNRDEKGELHPLPRKNIDTGMGLERIASVLQGTETNFEIDNIKPLIDLVAVTAGVAYNDDVKTDISLKVIVDHLRAVTFLVGDGVVPSNEGRGYVLRRLIRRAVRHGRLIGIDRPFVAAVVDRVAGLMGDAYPELSADLASIRTIVTGEEERFNHTLRQGLVILNEFIDQVKQKETTKLPGDLVFKLYDTYGFPRELTVEIAAESGLEVDEKTFEKLMADQRERARAEAVTAGGHAQLFVGTVYPKILDSAGKTEFSGYEKRETEASLVALVLDDLIVDKAEEGEEGELFLDQTPFYAEKGGQVGDIGTIESLTGKAAVTGSYPPVAELTAHKFRVTEGVISRGQTVKAIVDERRRRAISRNHTATHLLHWALRIIIGKHVKQGGSLVEAERLRFDFTHNQPLTADEISAVEQLVNEKILQDHPVRAYVTNFEYAKEIGALAFFEEKYGNYVRVVEVGDFSKELCGGVHLAHTSEIGFLKITSASSIGANTRRIEAITGEYFLSADKQNEERLEKLAGLLGVTVDQVLPAAEKTLHELAEAKTKLAAVRGGLIMEEAESILAGKIDIDGISLLSGSIPKATMDELRGLADRLRSKEKRSVVVLAAAEDKKVSLLVAATPSLVEDGFSAVEMIRRLSPIVDGGGGGRSDLAQAGGKNPATIPDLFPEAAAYIKRFNGK